MNYFTKKIFAFPGESSMRILVGVSSLLLLFSCGRQGERTKPVRKDVVQAVYASGKIFPVNDYKIYSKLPGYIQTIHVKIGDTVKRGQPLVTIKSEVSELNVDAARNLLQLAERNAGEEAPLLQALKQEVASAKSKYTLDSSNYSRYTALLSENATSKIQYDQAKTQFDISKQLFLKTKATLESTRERLRTELENARIQFSAQQSNKNEYTLVSALDGKVYDILPKEGELVNNQALLMEIGDALLCYVELNIDETDLSFVQKGQKIVYEADAYKDTVFYGVVQELYPRVSQGNKSAKVTASISLPVTETIYSGMSVEANIIVAEKKDALVIPIEYLVNGKFVKMSNGKLARIEKGIEDLQLVEVRNGLKEEDEIIKP